MEERLVHWTSPDLQSPPDGFSTRSVGTSTCSRQSAMLVQSPLAPASLPVANDIPNDVFLCSDDSGPLPSASASLPTAAELSLTSASLPTVKELNDFGVLQ